MKRIIFGIMLILILIGVLTLISNIRPVESVSEVLFFDDFDDGVADGWTVNLGNFQVINGEYYTENDFGEKSITTVDGLVFTDCLVQTNVRLQATEGGFQAAIILRYIDKEHHYTFSINAEGDCVSFEKYTPADPHYGELLAVNRSVSISMNTNYLLKVAMQGNTFVCFLDNEKVLSVTDSDYTSGQVGLRGQKADAYFDNFTVMSVPKTITVPDDYPTIQEAINNAGAGDVIYVKAGIYEENIVINESISLIGESRETTIIDGNGSGWVVNIECSYVTFRNFTVRNGTVGIWISETSQDRIEDNVVRNCNKGILIVTSLWFQDNHLLRNNIISDNKYGIVLEGCRNVTILQNDIINNTERGIELTADPRQAIEFRGSHNNLICCNDIVGNEVGIYLLGENNKFYHNNFLNNSENVQVYHVSYYENDWDNGYPSGGNYWGDYNGTDLFSGPYQNITGSDGIGDTPYVIDANNIDHYPLMKPWAPSINATVDIIPNILNLRSKVKYITAYIELPEDYNVSDIDVSSILLNNTIPVDPNAPIAIGDYDNDTIPDLMVKFNGTEVIKYILNNINMTKLIEERFLTITLTLTGKLKDGTQFQGSDTIRITMPIPGGIGKTHMLNCKKLWKTRINPIFPI